MSEPHAVDLQVGANLRRERKAAGWSQERLATAIGVSFQQLQKYEKGINRISASKLLYACRALSVRPSVLFGTQGPAEEPQADLADLELAASIQRLQPAHRRVVKSMIDVLRPDSTEAH